MTNSRSKGKRGELELAKKLRDNGYLGAKRGQQFKGGEDSPDVVCPGLTEEFHIECKNTARTDIYGWLAQAKNDANGKKVPLVAHKKNRQEWVVILSLDDFLQLQLMRGLPNG